MKKLLIIFLLVITDQAYSQNTPYSRLFIDSLSMKTLTPCFYMDSISSLQYIEAVENIIKTYKKDNMSEDELITYNMLINIYCRLIDSYLKILRPCVFIEFRKPYLKYGFFINRFIYKKSPRNKYLSYLKKKKNSKMPLLAWLLC